MLTSVIVSKEEDQAKFAATDLKPKKRFVNKPFRNKIMRLLPIPVSLRGTGNSVCCDLL